MATIETSSLAERLKQPALVIDRDGQVVAASAAAAGLLEASPEELLGCELDALLPEGTDGPLKTLTGRELEAEVEECELDDGERLLTLRDVSAERQTATQLADAERIAKVGIWDWQVPTNTVVWSREAYTLFGRDPSETPTYELWLEAVHPEDREWVNDFVQKAFAERTDYDFEHRSLHPDGTVRYLHCRGQVIVDENNEPLRLVGASQDITDEVLRKEELSRLNAQREAVLDAAAEGICGVDEQGTVVFANPAAASLLGTATDELIGSPLAERLDRERAARLEEAIASGSSFRDEDATFTRDSGAPLPVDMQCAPLGDAGRAGAVITFADVSDRKRYEEQLQFLADHDALTGLANRRRFEQEIATQTGYARQFGGSVAVLLLDLDHFKDVNDTSGHGAGDEMLRAMATRLREIIGSRGTLARVGGDEFAALLPATDRDAAKREAESLRSEISEHEMLVGGRSLTVTASIGIAVGDGSEDDAEGLLADADVAMYEAKESGRNGIAIYEENLGGRQRMRERLAWSTRLRKALDDGDGFELFAQPIAPLSTGRNGDGGGSRYELLIRMPDGDGGYILPATFLGVAERHGLIRDLDRWVVANSISIAADERRAGRETIVEINLSGRSMGDHDLGGFIEAELAGSEATAEQLVFEVTETAAIDNLRDARELANRLIGLGCSFAIDDFGAGFGSFAYLKHLPSQYVKIDGDFVRRLPSNADDQLVVRAITELAHGMGKSVIAEFVEDEETRRLLETLQVDYGQGYHLGRPGPIGEVMGAGLL